MKKEAHRIRWIVPLGFALALLAAACGGSTVASTTTAAPPEEAITTTKAPESTTTAETTPAAPDYAQFLGNPSPDQCAGREYNLGLDAFSDTESFALATVQGMQATAETMGCVTIDVLSDELDGARALDNVNIFIQQEKDGVILLQVLDAAQPAIVDALEASGTPGLASYVPAPGLSFIEVDLALAGFKGGEALGIEALNRWPGEDIFIIIGTFDEGGEVTIATMNGYEEGLLSVVPDFSPDNILRVVTMADPPTANANTAAVLARIPDDAKILVGAINDENTLAMLEAIRTAGRLDNAIGVGQGATLLDTICDGTMFATVAYFPELYGSFIVPAIVGLIQGQELPEYIELPTEVLTAENIGEFYSESAC